MRFPTDPACVRQGQSATPRARSSSPSVESVRRARSSGPLVVFSSTSCLAWLSSRCAHIWLRFDVSVCDFGGPCLRWTDQCCGRVDAFRASLFRRYSALRGMAWTPRALLPGDALRFSGASDHPVVCLEAPLSMRFSTLDFHTANGSRTRPRCMLNAMRVAGFPSPQVEWHETWADWPMSYETQESDHSPTATSSHTSVAHSPTK